MSRKSLTPVKEFCAKFALLVGFSVLYFVLWSLAFLTITGLIFVGLTIFTKWNIGARIGCSLFSSFVTMKVHLFISEVLELIPDTWLGGEKNAWIDRNKQTKPCPECGKNLRSALAQQCLHCGADWHA